MLSPWPLATSAYTPSARSPSRNGWGPRSRLSSARAGARRRRQRRRARAPTTTTSGIRHAVDIASWAARIWKNVPPYNFPSARCCALVLLDRAARAATRGRARSPGWAHRGRRGGARLGGRRGIRTTHLAHPGQRWASPRSGSGLARSSSPGGWMAASVACDANPDCHEEEQCREVPPRPAASPTSSA